MKKEEIIAIATQKNNNSGLIGGWLGDTDYKQFADLDGKHAAEYLKSKGFEVKEHYDTGHNGLAITKCNIHLSTNGHIYKK